MPSSRHPWKQTPRDTRAHAVIEGYLNQRGVDSGYKHTVALPDHRSANEGRLSIGRGARHFGLAAAVWVTGPDGQQCIDCQDPEAGHAVVFVLHSKERAQRYVAGQVKGEPARLKYNPYARRQ